MDGDALVVDGVVALHLAVEIFEIEKDGIRFAMSIEAARQIRGDEERTDMDSKRFGFAHGFLHAEQVERRARLGRVVVAERMVM